LNSHIDRCIVPQIRHIAYWSTVALASLTVQITADMPISDVRYQYQCDTSPDPCHNIPVETRV